MALQVREDFVDATRGMRYGDTPWSEAFTDDRGTLYRALVREYGRCTSKVYVDRAVPVCGDVLHAACETEAVPVGWVFVKRVEYDDAHRLPPGKERTYLREVWVTVRETETEEED